ncbi:MAG TPA: UDP-N-acetylmuramate dehydrogenase [Prevotella sp.]|nr:UDP-N-acetylmuramate dehydrogenase [Prevotella sp.]
MQTFKNASLLKRNTFGIDQRCDELVVYQNEGDARALALDARWQTIPYLLLGGGSNLLLTRDFPGLVITPEKRFDVRVEQENDQEVVLRCWAGTTFDDVVAYAVRHGWYGMENLSLIPGECGASAVQNIGAYGAEAKDIIVNVEAVELATGKTVVMMADECGYSYRQSRFKHEWKDKYVILSVAYRLSKTFSPDLDYGNIRTELERRGISVDRLTAQQLRDVIIDIRRAKLPDPEETGNAGSFFMNPIVDGSTFECLKAAHPDLRYFEMGDGRYKIPAGWMIDQCGWKGKSLGAAGVHDKQALVLVNLGGAKGADIVTLMRAVQASVKERFGLELHPEVNVI